MNEQVIKMIPAEKTDISSIIKKYQAQLKGYISKRIPSKEEAEDILQNVFYQLTKMYQKEEPIQQISGWLYAVARNQITDSYRRQRDEYVPLQGNSENEESYHPEIYDETESPEEDFLKGIVWEELEIALQELPAEQRNIFELTELEGFSFKEISETTGIPVNTLLSRKRYAVLHLRKRMKELYDDLLYE